MILQGTIADVAREFEKQSDGWAPDRLDVAPDIWSRLSELPTQPSEPNVARLPDVGGLACWPDAELPAGHARLVLRRVPTRAETERMIAQMTLVLNSKPEPER